MISHLYRQRIRRSSDRADAGSGGPTRAVVLGGSLAGLLSARVLADHVDEVVVVDRDDLDGDSQAARRGVPQGRHTHGLLMRGAEAIEGIVPGFTQGLCERGALRTDVMSRARLLMGDNVLARRPSGLVGIFASRTLIEDEVRRRVREVAGISFLGDHDVTGLLATPDRSRVTGALVTARRAGSADAGSPAPVELLADLVVDATGRGSRASVWLRELGYQPPEQTEVSAQVLYRTRWFQARPGVLDDLDGDVVGTRPSFGRGGVALRQEGDRWAVTLTGQHGEDPPGDLPGFLAYAQTLPTQGIAQIVAACPPIGEPLAYRFPTSRWLRWEQLTRRPQGLVVIGDAVCSFNPIYGQGMSSAAHQAQQLRALLVHGGTYDLAARCAAAFAAVVATPWLLATGADRRFPGMAPKPLPERLLDRYLDRLLAVATDDHHVTLAFVRVLNLLAAPSSLLTPRLAWRVLGPGSIRTVRTAQVSRVARAATTTRRPPAPTSTPRADVLQ